jgi:hypothetical protein
MIQSAKTTNQLNETPDEAVHKYITGAVDNPIVTTQRPSSAEIGITVPRKRKRI